MRMSEDQFDGPPKIATARAGETIEQMRLRVAAEKAAREARAQKSPEPKTNWNSLLFSDEVLDDKQKEQYPEELRRASLKALRDSGETGERIATEFEEEIKDAADAGQEISLFELYTDCLKKCVDNPNKEKERALGAGRGVILDAARAAKVWQDASEKLVLAQKTEDFDQAKLRVGEIPEADLEDLATKPATTNRNSPDFKGIVSTYIEIARVVMDRDWQLGIMAYMESKGRKGNPAYVAAERTAKDLSRKIKLVGWKTPPASFVDMARKKKERDVAKQKEMQTEDEEAQDLLHKISEGIAKMGKKLEDFTSAIQEQTDSLVESSRRLPPLRERARWIDVGYRQDNYTRFSPTLEPNYYLQLPAETNFDRNGHFVELGQRDWDAIWTLSRAAYYKRSYQAFPSEYVKNQDLQQAGKEQMERMYRIPGVREMMEGYADAIVRGTSIPLVDQEGKPIIGRDGNQATMKFWDIKDGFDLEKFRVSLRAKELGFGFMGSTMSDAEKEYTRQNQMLVDTIAWDFMDCGLLPESMDSRYSRSGERHADLPYEACSDDYRALMHPQEKFEAKAASGQEWGAFGRWGRNQVEVIRNELGYESDARRDKSSFIRFVQARGGTWTGTKARVTPRGDGRNGYHPDSNGDCYLIYAPECYPTTTTRSFWEESRARDARGSEKSLLEFLVNREEVNWETAGEGTWASWLVTKFNKAVGLHEVFSGNVPLEHAKEESWVKSVVDLHARLKMNRLPVTTGTYESFQTLSRLKSLEIYASKGGVQDPTNRKITCPVRWGTDRAILNTRLKLRYLQFLDPNESVEYR